jgi:uncharacterized repeat protein (TIGR03803 family)
MVAGVKENLTMLRSRRFISPTLCLCIGLLSFAIGTPARPVPTLPVEKILHTFVAAPDGQYPQTSLVQAKNGDFYGTTELGGLSGLGTLFRVTAAGELTTLHSFSGPDGSYPYSALIQGKDGRLYGTTLEGGDSYEGTVFAVNSDGKDFVTLYSFDYSDGSEPDAAVIQGQDGRLYGTTADGGANGCGTVFAMDTDGSNLTTLHPFAGPDGAFPEAGLIQGKNGKLYGTTFDGGPAWDGSTNYGDGTVFDLNTAGTVFNTVHSFSGSDGSNPAGAVMIGTDGRLYGTTEYGGANDWGTVFAMNANGMDIVTLHSFDFTDGYWPYAGLIQGNDGRLYGTTPLNGEDGNVFAIDTGGGGFVVIHPFDWYDGALPFAGVVQGNNGMLYGAAEEGGGSFGGGAIFDLSTDGTVFNTLYTFHETQTGPQYPVSSLLKGKSGVFYGTTPEGGPDDYGAIYKVNSATGTVDVLHSFSYTDGAYPYGPVILGKDGRLYGTTEGGGANDAGSVFAMDLDGGNFVTLRSFSGADGASPEAGLIQGKDGRLYGTTLLGGANGEGTVFAMDTDGNNFVTLRSFSGADGIQPYSAVMQGTDGRLYGTTEFGGTIGDGTVFAMDTGGSNFVTLCSFTGANGFEPLGGVIQGSDGRLYGTTYSGGAFGSGDVFAMTVHGDNPVTLHSFDGTDGAYLANGVIEGSDGNIYGTTDYDGPNAAGPYGGGTVFAMTSDGSSFTTEHAFSNTFGLDGYVPSGVIEGGDGNLYGTTALGGVPPGDKVAPAGTVFQIVLTLPSITGFSPATGAVGSTVTIAGVNLAGATSVTIAGVSAAITSNTATQIAVTVPAGATTGKIMVTTPTGTATSAAKYTVTP